MNDFFGELRSLLQGSVDSGKVWKLVESFICSRGEDEYLSSTYPVLRNLHETAAFELLL